MTELSRTDDAVENAAAVASALRLLVVDDDEVDRMAVRRALASGGLRALIDEASTTIDALQLVATKAFDCVILDYNIPGGDGLTLLKGIRATGLDVPIIMLTGHGDEQVAVQLMKAGAVDYLSKSAATPDRLTSSVKYAIELARAQAAARRAAMELEASADRARVLYEAAERARARTEVLQRVTAQLATVLPREDIGRLFVRQVHESLGADTTWLALLTPDGTELHTVDSVGFAPEMIAQFQTLEVDAPLPTRDVLREGRERTFSSREELLEAYPALREPMRDMAQEAVVLLPIVSNVGVAGVVSAGFDTVRTFDPDEIALAMALARQCAQALERARLYEAERVARAAAESARREAERANAAKSDFLARMSHDLRTPLNAIAGFAQLIDEGIYGAPTDGMRQSLGRILRAQQHLLTLINDVLSFAKLEAGQVRVSISSVPVEPVIDELLVLVETQAAAKGVNLERCIETPNVRVRADKERLAQIIVNLLTNAIKFTEPGGTVGVSAHATPSVVRIEVRDTGVGIEPAKLKQIFQPFVQVSEGSEEQKQGVGLGLAISRELARRMNGKLSVRSTLGEGSVFTLTLPRDLRKSERKKSTKASGVPV